MFRSFLKSAWRLLLKDRQFTLLNLIGLSTGLATVLLIYLWISDELHMDKLFQHDSRIYQVMKNVNIGGGTILTFAWTPGPLAKALKQEMPEVESSVTVVNGEQAGKGIVSVGNTHIRAAELHAGDDFFRIFTYPMVEGNADEALKESHNVVISDQLAMRLFNTTHNVVGQKIEWAKEDSGLYVVSAVFKKPLYNSSLDFDLVFSMAPYRAANPNLDTWGFSSPDTYILLKEQADPSLLSRKLAGFMRTKVTDTSTSLFMRRYADKYLYGKFDNGVQTGGRISYVHLFSAVALFILLIACVNFMNLSTAKAARRMREVGIKKAIGARSWSIAVQFLCESVLLTFLSLLFAILLVFLFFSSFEAVTGKHLQVEVNTSLVLSVIGITLITGIISGSYPALYISRIKSTRALKGVLANYSGELLVRKALVIFQFTVSSLLIVAVLVVYRQTNFIHSMNLGLNKDNVITFKREGKLGQNILPFLQEVRSLSGVQDATCTDNQFTSNPSGTHGMVWPGKSPTDVTEFKYLDVGYDFTKTMEIKLEEGRDFSPGYGRDSTAVIFNQAAIDIMGIKDPLGKSVRYGNRQMTIIGVAENFHFESLYEKIKPCFFLLFPSGSNILVRVKGGMEKEAIDRMQELYARYNPGYPFDFSFLDQQYQVLYESENRVASLSWYFASIAIIISCLGLFGLAAFTAQKRRKEISIRKVVGASVTDVVIILSKDFLKLILIAMLIAMPVSWWVAKEWLNGFAYRIPLGADIFFLSIILVILITLLTIGYQSIRSAVANPVKALRSE